MERAIELANIAFDAGEIPVGAVVVNYKTKKIIGEGYNRREIDKSPTAHAEILAIENASEIINDWRLSDCDLYVTLEPCPMCCGAIINSRIRRVYFGAYDLKQGCVTSVMNMFDMDFNHKPEYYGGIYENQCKDLLYKFFDKIR